MESKLTISDLKKFAKSNARLAFVNYGEPISYRMDRNNVLRGKYAATKAAGFWWNRGAEPLLIGEYFGTRLMIKENSIEYIPGQYAPVEIYWALADYFSQVYRKEMSK